MHFYKFLLLSSGSAGQEYWVGIHDEIPGVYTFLDGTIPEWANWGLGEPSSYGQCVYIDSAYDFRTAPCSTAKGYVCEQLTGQRRQI